LFIARVSPTSLLYFFLLCGFCIFSRRAGNVFFLCRQDLPTVTVFLLHKVPKIVFLLSKFFCLADRPLTRMIDRFFLRPVPLPGSIWCFLEVVMDVMANASVSGFFPPLKPARTFFFSSASSHVSFHEAVSHDPRPKVYTRRPSVGTTPADPPLGNCWPALDFCPFSKFITLCRKTPLRPPVFHTSFTFSSDPLRGTPPFLFLPSRAFRLSFFLNLASFHLPFFPHRLAGQDFVFALNSLRSGYELPN